MQSIRRAHMIKENKSNEAPHHFIFLDTETYTTPRDANRDFHHLKLGWACYWRRLSAQTPEIIEWLEFKDTDAFWDWCLAHIKPKTRLVLLAHNIEFDVPVMAGFKALRERGWKTEEIFTREKVSIWRFTKGTRTLLILDNLNFFHASLATIGEQIGFEKLGVDFATVDDNTLSTYCRRDVEILLRLWQGYICFLEEHRLGSFGKSVASQAFNAYRHRFMPRKIIVHDHALSMTMERASYHGGRCEIFRFGVQEGGPFYKLDVNSMYPFVMHERLYPYKLVRYYSRVDPGLILRLKPRQGVVAQVLLETETPVYCTYHNHKLVFPIGKFETVLAGPEFNYAWEHHHIKKIVQLSVYALAPLFIQYVDYVYALRLEYKKRHDPVLEYFCKLMLNSLYGKFAQRTSEWSNVGEEVEHPNGIERVWHEGKKLWINRRYINGLVQVAEEMVTAFNAFTAIASYVTAYARLYLWWLCNQAGRENVYYVDTDSLIVNQTGYDKLQPLLHPIELGKLKVEGVADRLELYGPKDYVFGETVRIKGISAKAKKLEDGLYGQTHFPGLEGLLRDGNINRYFTVTLLKVLARSYDKGVVHEDGRVTPLVLAEWTPEGVSAS